MPEYPPTHRQPKLRLSWELQKIASNGDARVKRMIETLQRRHLLHCLMERHRREK